MSSLMELAMQIISNDKTVRSDTIKERRTISFVDAYYQKSF